MKKPVSRITIGNLEEVMKPDAIKAALAEFICMIFFIFPAEGTVLYLTKMIPSKDPSHVKDPSNVNNLAIALTHGFALFASVAVGVNLSGGHASPAVTFGAFVGGHITFVRTILYWIAQCLGGIVAMYLLKLASNGQTVYGWGPNDPLHAIIYEIIMVFMLVYAYYATILEPKRGDMGVIGPLVIGLICAACVLCGGGFFGAAMNPAMALSIAVITSTWVNHWAVWVGTFIGAAIAGSVYQTIYIGEDIYEQLPITNN